MKEVFIIKFKCLKSFSGPKINGHLGEVIEITDKEVIKDLEKVKYIEKLNPKISKKVIETADKEVIKDLEKVKKGD